MISKEKLDSGRVYEKIVGDYFSKRGWDVEMYTSKDENGNETSQSIIIDTIYCSHPDIIIEKTESKILVKYLVEVKSQTKYRKKGDFPKSLSVGIDYVSVPYYQFVQYKKVMNHYGVPLYIVFVDKNNETTWFWQEWNIMNKTKIYVDDAYDDGIKHLFWDIEDLVLLQV